MKPNLPSLFLTVLALSACGCITNIGGSNNAGEPVKANADAGSPPSSEQNPLSTVRVGAEFQKQMHAALAGDGKYTAAYGLFSEGGWSNAGQTWILANDDFSVTKIFRVKPNKEESGEVAASTENLAQLKASLSSVKELQPVEENMFDGLIYEFTKLVRKGDKITLDTNVYIKSTDLTKHPRHNALVNAFSTLAE